MGTTPEYIEAETGEDPHPIAPVPVHIVDAVRVLEFPPASFVSQTIGVSGIPQRVAPRHPLRSELLIANTGSETVYIAPDPSQAGASVGYPLAGGAQLRLTVRADVWAATAGAAGSLALLAQYRDG